MTANCNEVNPVWEADKPQVQESRESGPSGKMNNSHSFKHVGAIMVSLIKV